MADFLPENPQGEEIEDTLIKLYKTLSVMFSNLDSKNIKSIETGKTKISSGDGYCEIDGGQIIMRDKDGTERLKMGSDKNGNFVFYLKNANGTKTLSLSSDGNAIFSGDIKTTKDAEVGSVLYIGKDDTTEGQKRIQFYDSTNDLKGVKIVAVKDDKGITNLKIISEKIILNTLDGVEDAFGNRFVTTNFTPYVTINGQNYYVKFR